MAGVNELIKFDPQKLMEVSAKLEEQHKKFIQQTASIKKKSENLMVSWQSDSSALYIAKLRELDIQSAEMANALLSFSRNLASASGVYKVGESNAERKAEALPIDGIFLV